MSSALAENFSPGWKRASAGVGFGGALAENEGTSLNQFHALVCVSALLWGFWTSELSFSY